MDYNKTEVIKKISDIKLQLSIDKVVPNRKEFDSIKKIVWGAGVSGKSFIEMHRDLGFAYIVDTRENLQGNTYLGFTIKSPDVLFREDPNDVLVFLPTVIHKKLTIELKEKGFNKIVVPNHQNTSGVGFSINRIHINAVFDWLNKNNIQYVCLKPLPVHFDEVNDLDIMISTDDIGKLLNCPYLMEEPDNDIIYLDVIWDKPLGINAEIPIYPIKLSKMMLDESNVMYINNKRALNPKLLLISYLYITVIKDASESAVKKRYSSIKLLQEQLNLTFDITLEGMWQYLSATEYFPMLDFIRKWQAFNGSSFLADKTRRVDEVKNDYVVYVFRDFFRDKPELLSDVIDLIKSSGFKEMQILDLNEQELNRVKQLIRGGVWEDSYQSKLGGGPYKFGIFINNFGDVRATKEKVRQYVNKRCGIEVNSIHSSDDTHEAIEYMKVVKYNFKTETVRP